MSKKTDLEIERAKALDFLRTVLKPKSTVYSVMRSVSRSGMSRRFDVYAIVDNDTVWLTPYLVTLGLGRQSFDEWRKGMGMRVDGCGMDMGFHVAYNLGRMLWPKGTRKPHGTRNGQPDRDGGYALRHQWI